MLVNSNKHMTYLSVQEMLNPLHTCLLLSHVFTAANDTHEMWVHSALHAHAMRVTLMAHLVHNSLEHLLHLPT
jgi:hypothetical protein